LKNPLFDPAAVHVELLDLLGERELAKRFRGLDILAHFAGKVGYSVAEKREVWDINVLGTRKLFEAAARAGVGKVLYVSSVSALGAAPEGRLLHESDRPYDRPRSAWSLMSREAVASAIESSARGDYGFLRSSVSVYLDSKLAGLELAHSSEYWKGLGIVTILPGTAIGPGEVHAGIGALVEKIWKGELAFSLPGMSSFMDSGDFARGAVLAMEKGKPGEDYILAGAPESNLSYADFAALVTRTAAGRGGTKKGPSRPFVTPPFLALAGAALAERIAPGLGLSRGLVASGLARIACDSGKAIRELGYEPSTPLAESILAYARAAGLVQPLTAPKVSPRMM
jgi:dihydroflavonol-4-reductase